MQGTYENSAGQALRHGAIDTPARAKHRDAEAIPIIRERHDQRLRPKAPVRDSLRLLVARHTREALRPLGGGR